MRAKDVLLMRSIPVNVDTALLVLRFWGILPLFLKHGWEKVFAFSAMAAHAPDPLHIGPVKSLVFSMVSDFICSILIMLGCATRWAALIMFVNISVAWAFVEHFIFFGRGADHGELIILYMAILVTLFLAGPGRYSVDAHLAD